jgi:hypothetical protein
VKGGGASLLTSGIMNIGAQVHINGETASRLQLSITSGKRLIRLCTFSAEVVSEGGRTQLRVGGLETYRTNQAHFFYVIPAGPKAIAGMDPYKRFLDAIRQVVQQQDPSAQVSVDTPEV